MVAPQHQTRTPPSLTAREVSICICTYKRPAQLQLLLQDLSAQTVLPAQVVVVDNDAARTGEVGTVGHWPFELVYDVQPEKNISLTRNRSIARATAAWIGILDDDERVPADWLEGMCRTAADGDADGVIGGVRAVLPADAPAWLDQRFFPIPQNPHAEPFPINRISSGNALVRATTLRAVFDGPRAPYDPRLGLSGGEDTDFYCRLQLAGARMVWCGTVQASEPVAPDRQNLRWLKLRALRGGQDYARNFSLGHYRAISGWQKIRFAVEAFGKLAVAASVLLVVSAFSQRQRAYWTVKAYANIGKLSGLRGGYYAEYGH